MSYANVFEKTGTSITPKVAGDALDATIIGSTTPAAGSFTTGIFSGLLTAKTGRSATLTVAANNSSALSKAQADYVCDGTDDNVEIQAALDALPAITFWNMSTYKPGSVILFEGSFKISDSIIISKGQELIGQGIHKTELFLSNGSNTSIITNNQTESTSFNRIAYMTLTGNKANQTSGYGIYFGTQGSTFITIDNVRVWYCKQSGIYIDYGYQHNIINSIISHNDGYGVYSGSNVENGTHIILSVIEANLGTYQIYINTNGGSEHRISNCYIESGVSSGGIYSWGYYVNISHNYINCVGGNAIKLASIGNVVSNNIIHNSGGDAAIEGYACNKIIVTGNVIYNTASGTDGILFTGTLTGIVIQGNSVTVNSPDEALRISYTAPSTGTIITGNYLNGVVSFNHAHTKGILKDNIVTGSLLFYDTSLNFFEAYNKYIDIFMDVLAVSTTHVRSNEDLSEAIPNTFTIDAQPDVPRTLSGHFDAHAQITAYTIVITGKDAKDNTVTETKTAADGWDWETSNAFATITSIIMTARTGTGAGDTMDIGITDVLGLSNTIYSTSDVFKIKKNNANATVAVAQVNTTYDTYDMSVITLGAGDDFTIWYKSNLNIIS